MKYLSKWIITIYVIAFVLTILSIISPTTCATTTRISQTSLPSPSDNISTAVSTAPPSTSKFTSTSSVETSLASKSITTNTVLTNTAPPPETITSTTSTDFLTDTTTAKILSTSDYSSSPTPNVTKVSTADFSSITSDFAVTTADHTTAVSTAIDTTTWTTDSTTDSTTYNTTRSSSSITTTTMSSSSITTSTISSSNISTPTMSSSNLTTQKMSSSNITTRTMSSSNITTTTMPSLSITTPTMSSSSTTTHTFPSTEDNTTDPTSYSTTVPITDTSMNTQSSTTDKTTETTTYGARISTSDITTPTTNTPYASNDTTTESTLYNTTVSRLGIITTSHGSTGSTTYSTMVSLSGITRDTTTSETANTTYPLLPNTTVPTSTDTTFPTTVNTTNSTSYHGTPTAPGITTPILIPTTPNPTISTSYNNPTSTTDTTFTTVTADYTTTSYRISVPISDTTTTVKTTTTTTPVTNASSTTAPPARTTTAKEIDCGPVPNISNGVIISDNTTYGSLANVTCNTGYHTPVPVIQCTAAGIWDNSSCTLTDCGQVPTIVHGFINSTNTTYGSLAKVTCIPGHNTTKSDIRCTADGFWENTTCTIIDCSRVPTISNGVINLDYTKYGSLANVTCNTGYNTSKPAISCTAVGTWENSTCIIIDCGNITETPPTNGTLVSPVTTTYGSRYVYSCNDGYRNVGSAVKECLANGSWSSTAPNCSIKDCGPVLGTIKNGQMNNPTNTTTYGSVMKFKCDEGYTLIGVSSIQCTKLGQWNGLKPTCHKDVPRTCKTENDNRGTNWTETPIDTTALQRCADGFEGNITRQCSVDGIWQFPLYSCIRISVKDIDNKLANLTSNASTETFNTALDAITTETTRSQNSTADQKLTDGELTLLSTALEKVASVLSPSVVKNENITNSFIESASNLIDSTNKDSWKALSSTNNGAEKVLSAVSSMGEALAESLKDGGNKTTIIKNNIAMEVKKFDDEVLFPDPHTNASDKETQWITESKSSIRLDSDALSGSGPNITYITTAVMYRDMSEILPSKRSSVNGSDEATEEKEKINGPILALSIIPTYNVTLNPPVTITFKHQLTNYTSPLCSYWSYQNDSQGWSSNGCKVNSTNDSFTVCTCDHLTNFAILMSPFREADTSSKALRTISIVGISVSIVCLIAVFVLHFALWRYLRNDRTTVLMNLCVALLLSYIIFLAGVDRTESNAACTIIAAILHYIYLVVFCVMLVEGILIATIVHFVFNSKFRVKILLVIAWVLPAVIVGISLGASKTLGYGNNSVCWLSTDKGLIWAFVGPALIIITFNVVCILIVIRAIFSTKAMETKKASEKVKTSLRSLAVLVPLMGVSWIVGIFYVDESLDFIQYIFAILNGLQGFFIFLFHCPLNYQVKKGLRLWRRRTSWTWLRTTSGTTSSKYKDSNELRETDRSYVDSVDYTSRSNNDWREKALDYNLPTLPSTSWLNRSKDSASRLSSHAYNTISDDWTSPRPFSSQI